VENRYPAIIVASNDRCKLTDAGFGFTRLPEEKIIHVIWFFKFVITQNRVNNKQDSKNLFDPLNVADIREDMVVQGV